LQVEEHADKAMAKRKRTQWQNYTENKRFSNANHV